MKTLILNHKMNLEYDYVYEYIDKLNKIEKDVNIIVCPSNIYLSEFVNNSEWSVGAQNASYQDMGDYTGDVNTVQLKSMGIEYSIVGHYERRKYYQESIEDINEKLIACLDSNMIPILCFGSDGNISNIKKELDGMLKNIDNINFVVFAYEPIEVVSDKDIDTISNDIDEIYKYLEDKYKVSPNIIYGGDVYNKDINALFNIDKLNGVIVGSISSDIEKVLEIVDRI